MCIYIYIYIYIYTYIHIYIYIERERERDRYLACSRADFRKGRPIAQEEQSFAPCRKEESRQKVFV